MQGKVKDCKNCRAKFDKKDPAAAKLLCSENFNVNYCSNCGWVHSFKKYIYTLTLNIPEITALVKKYVDIKRQVTFIRLAELTREFLTIKPELEEDFATLVGTRKVSPGEITDALIREHRFKTAKEEDLPLINRLVSVGFFKYLSERRNSMTNETALEILLKQNPLFLTTCGADSIDAAETIGHYHGSSGNCAKKVATRLWRSLRFLHKCNLIAQKLNPETLHLIDLNYNKQPIASVLKRLTATSRDKVARLLEEAQKENYVPDCFFRVSITRKETKYVVPLVTREVPSKKGTGAPMKQIKKGKSRRLFIQDFKDATVETRKLKPKEFEYLAIMNIQKAEKMAEVLKKMGDDIWLANVYTLARKPETAPVPPPAALNRKPRDNKKLYKTKKHIRKIKNE